MAILPATNLGMMLPDRLPSSDLDFAICFLPFSICHSPKSGCIHFPHTERLQNHGDRHAAISGTSWRSFCTAQLVVLSIPSAIVGPIGRNEPVWGGQISQKQKAGQKLMPLQDFCHQKYKNTDRQKQWVEVKQLGIVLLFAGFESPHG